MRAFVVPTSGASPRLGEVPTPVLGDGELLVRVAAASVNGFDLAVAAGYLEAMMEHRFPVVLGKDFAGTVEAVGAGVEEFAVGDRVFGVVTKSFLGDGSFGESVTVPAGIGIAALPSDVSFVDAAALGLAGTAAAAGIDAIDPRPGQTVLVVGATGGVGNHAVRLVAAAGATVIATADTEAAAQLVRSLGAAHVVDHTNDLAAAVCAIAPDGVDAVLHLAGDPAAALALVRAGGTLASTLGASPESLPSDTVTVVSVMANPARDVLDTLAAGQSNQTAPVTIQRTYRLDDAPQAFADFGRGTLGKLVLELD